MCCVYREFAKSIRRPFTVHYNPYTQGVDVLKDTDSINSMVKDIRHELDIVEDALNRLSVWESKWAVGVQSWDMICIELCWNLDPTLSIKKKYNQIKTKASFIQNQVSELAAELCSSVGVFFHVPLLRSCYVALLLAC